MEDEANLYDSNQIYSSYGLDQQIIRPDIKSNVIYKRVPVYEEVEEYLKDKDGELIPIVDDVGTIQRDKQGNILYKTIGKKRVQTGTKIVATPVAAPNFASINRNTSSLDDSDLAFLMALDQQDSMLMEFQEFLSLFDRDLSKSMFRHNALRISIESLKKGKDQVTVQAIKTFTTISKGSKTVENIDTLNNSFERPKSGKNLLELAAKEQQQGGMQ